jgi:hypothetical protein
MKQESVKGNQREDSHKRQRPQAPRSRLAGGGWGKARGNFGHDSKPRREFTLTVCNKQKHPDRRGKGDMSLLRVSLIGFIRLHAVLASALM